MPDERDAASVVFASGFFAGVAVTGLLNPIDRALFLSVQKRRPFLDPLNFRRPFQGLGQSLVGRAVSSGLWFPLERLTHQAVTLHAPDLPPGAAAALAGQTAGVVNATLLSPLSYVKYQTWGVPEGKRSFGRTASKVLHTIGPLGFLRGLPATVLRDAIFGGSFGFLRTRGRATAEKHLHSVGDGGGASFAVDVLAAGVATTLSSPLNYARNVQFGAPVSSPSLGTWAAIAGLAQEVRKQPTVGGSMAIALQRTNVGWGTLRVAGGMALTADIFARMVRLGGATG